MSSVSSVLICRGTELISARLRHREHPQMHDWLGPLIVIPTAVAFGLAIFWVDYTCAHVIATLAAVEDSNPNSYVRLDSEDSNHNDPEVADASTTKSLPITSGLRSAIKHLRARGGIGRASVDFASIVPIPRVSRTLIGSFFVRFVASMLVATWQMAWVHLVIADRSPRSNYRRMLGLRHWPRTAPAAALYSFLTCATFSLPRAVSWLCGWTVGGVVESSISGKGLLGFLVIGILPAVFSLLLSVPARGIFTRVAASMLPEEDEPIVPFDRLFGGKVKPGVVLGVADAWTTFDWPACTRYVKVILKALAMEVALGLVGILLIMGELALLAFVTPTRQDSSSHQS
ncbi:hypothetical protein CNMCM5793_000233 [Aspergillus hiratsukae]|uniref:Uncharacterized protein n=1 Tax=Aspergillus hiratsukae TaxID=1194566 RepID=A0A8H6P9F9_9EURO|nr:hypothetical protein CNMCM5793_000233 [Aspergillus hiratsukae]KAF7163643.1 hypothetical protein CNMCM6106_000498 [Aspergillus hiratsukae]